MLSIVDSHAHLDSKGFDSDREQVVTRALDAGVMRIVNPGANLESSRQAVALATKYDCIYAAVGVHPNDTAEFTDQTLVSLMDLAQCDKVVALGEIGLDYYRDLSPRNLQKKVFRQQLGLARSLGLPVIVHIRNAYDDAMEILQQEAVGLRGVLHCYSGDLKVALQAIEMGWFISIAGPVTYPNAQGLGSVVSDLPLERLMVETDCPYLAPQRKRGKRNEPAYVQWVVEELANIKGAALEEVARVTVENACNLFSLACD